MPRLVACRTPAPLLRTGSRQLDLHWHHSSRNCFSPFELLLVEAVQGRAGWGSDGSLSTGYGIHPLMRPQCTLSPPWGLIFRRSVWTLTTLHGTQTPLCMRTLMMCGEESLIRGVYKDPHSSSIVVPFCSVPQDGASLLLSSC